MSVCAVVEHNDKRKVRSNSNIIKDLMPSSLPEGIFLTIVFLLSWMYLYPFLKSIVVDLLLKK